MSVKELILKDNPLEIIVKEAENIKGAITIYGRNVGIHNREIPLIVATIDRNQAHLLKLWLEEYLG